MVSSSGSIRNFLRSYLLRLCQLYLTSSLHLSAVVEAFGALLSTFLYLRVGATVHGRGQPLPCAVMDARVCQSLIALSVGIAPSDVTVHVYLKLRSWGCGEPPRCDLCQLLGSPSPAVPLGWDPAEGLTLLLQGYQLCFLRT